MTLAKISGHRDLSILLNVYYREDAASIARRLDAVWPSRAMRARPDPRASICPAAILRRMVEAVQPRRAAASCTVSHCGGGAILA